MQPISLYYLCWPRNTWCATQACYLTLPAPFLLSEKLNIPPFIRNYTQKVQNISMSNTSISNDLTLTRQTYYGDDKWESSLFPTSDNSLIMLFPQVESMCLDTAIWLSVLKEISLSVSLGLQERPKPLHNFQLKSKGFAGEHNQVIL